MIYKQGDIKDLYKGSVKAKELYKGSQLLYSADKSLVLLDGANNYAEFSFAASQNATYVTGDMQMSADALIFTASQIVYTEGIPFRTTIATKDSINLTKYNKLFIDWEKSNSSTPISQYVVAGYHNLKVSTAPNPYISKINQNILYNQTFSRRITEVDISAATGDNYIIIGNAIRCSLNGTSTLTIYKIWLE